MRPGDIAGVVEAVSIDGNCNRTDPAVIGSTHDLWIGDHQVLTVTIDKRCHEFPPVAEQCDTLNEMIGGLARAAKAVVFHAANDTESTADFAMQPIEDIASAIILLSQLSSAIRHESRSESMGEAHV